MEHVRFVLPFHTVFYAPHYLAMALGLFSDEGVEVRKSHPYDTVVDPSRAEAAIQAVGAR